MNQTYKATLSQYALPQFLPTWGGKGGVIWGDLEGWSLETMMFEKYPSISPYTYCANNPMMYVDSSGKEFTDPPTDDPPSKYKRACKGIANMGFGGLTAGFGVLYGASTEGIGYFLGGAALISFGSYKFVVGLNQFNNAISGELPNNDPKYVTPIGAATKNEVIDNVTDLVVGGPTPKKIPNMLKVINTVSAFSSAKNLDKSLDNSQPLIDDTNLKHDPYIQDQTAIKKNQPTENYLQ
ncbi:MAG: hypothetical protein PHI52_00865 [Bacteroidales bacterium]|nr:hypothetical protein [Bacteroidales bacterium]